MASFTYDGLNKQGQNVHGEVVADNSSIAMEKLREAGVIVTDIKEKQINERKKARGKKVKIEDVAIFARQKTYIEHVTHKDLQEIEKPYYNIKCAGMPQRCKNLFQLSMEGYEPTEDDEFSEEAREFLKTKRTMEDFKIGLCVPGKLMPKRIRGGTLLVETTYEMR